MLTDVISFTSQDYQTIRRHAVKFCYQQEIHQEYSFTDDVFEDFVKHFEIQLEYQSYFKELITKTFENRQKCDKFIEKYSKNWKLYRIAKVDLCILRIAITELLEREKINPAIIISDALSIAEEFSSKDSIKFINGILDSIVKEIKKSLKN